MRHFFTCNQEGCPGIYKVSKVKWQKGPTARGHKCPDCAKVAHNKAVRAYHSRRIAAGFCPYCPHPLPKGRAYCSTCQEKRGTQSKEYQIRQRAKRQITFTCASCKRKITLPKGVAQHGRQFCSYCAKTSYSEAHLRAAKAYQARKKAAGLCRTCGRGPLQTSRACSTCSEKARLYYEKKQGRSYHPYGPRKAPVA